jgi:hypothetical protein
MRKSLFLLIAILFSSMMLSTNLAMALTTPSSAKFGVASVGKCLVQYDAFFNAQPDTGLGDYLEWKSAAGLFGFAGEALTDKWNGGPSARYPKPMNYCIPNLFLLLAIDFLKAVARSMP